MTQIRILSVSRHLFQLPFFSVPRELSAAIPVIYESNLNLVFHSTPYSYWKLYLGRIEISDEKSVSLEDQSSFGTKKALDQTKWSPFQVTVDPFQLPIIYFLQ